MEEITKEINEEVVASQVADTDQNLSIDGMYQQLALPSLAKSVCETVKLEGPTGGVFAIKNDNGDFKLLRNDAEVFASDPISTGITREAFEDIQSMFGKSAKRVIGTLLKGLSNDQENDKLIPFIKANAGVASDITLSDPTHAWTTFKELTQKIHELVVKMNSKNQRTFHTFVILPVKFAGTVLSTENQTKRDGQSKGLYISTAGLTEYFINPDVTDTDIYIGLFDKNVNGKNSITYSPYKSEIVTAVDPDSGNETYHIYNRFALTMNPLHEAGNEMLLKFGTN